MAAKLDGNTLTGTTQTSHFLGPGSEQGHRGPKAQTNDHGPGDRAIITANTVVVTHSDESGPITEDHKCHAETSRLSRAARRAAGVPQTALNMSPKLPPAIFKAENKARCYGRVLRARDPPWHTRNRG